MRKEATVLIQQLVFGLDPAALGATALLPAFRSSACRRPCPECSAIGHYGASLHLLGAGQLTPTSVLRFDNRLGIAIDDTVHFQPWLRQGTAGCRSLLAVAAATQTAGQVMVLTTEAAHENAQIPDNFLVTVGDERLNTQTI
jgi:hypothetical protein